MAYELKDYREVPERIAEWYQRHPEGRIVCEVLEWTDVRVMVRATAYRTADPNEPPAGVGHSFLTIPGKTPYTKDSELENAETSAAGRALVMAGIPAKQVSSEQEVRSKSEPVEPVQQRKSSGSDGMAGTDEGAGYGEGSTPDDTRALSSQVRTLLRIASDLRWADSDITAALHEAFPGVSSLKELTQLQARELIPTWEAAARALRINDEQVQEIRTLASLADAKIVAERLFSRKVPNIHTLTYPEGDQLIEALREARAMVTT